MKEFQPLKVFCHAGFRGEEYPTAFEWDNTRLEIEEIEKRWLEPEWRYFQVKCKKGRCFLLRFREVDSQWQGQLFSRIQPGTA
ncbi:MAG: hypothetical protein JXK94_08915 [Deltaproteobacteria bacterium]|nr:hypothetical protein [Deltaproteobacteria bacterium]